MSAVIDAAVAATDGLPRRNGELVFEQPWQARAFGLAVVVCREQGLDWETFRSRLVEEIGSWEHDPDEDWSYYDRWLDALERLVVELDLVRVAELSRRVEHLAHKDAHAHDDHGHHPHHHP